MSDTNQDCLELKYARLRSIFETSERALVAFSGGVDSALLAVVARDVLGDRMLAVTALSPSFPDSDREDALALATAFGIPHRLIETREIDNPDYRKNLSNRCFFCKSELFASLHRIAVSEGYAVIFDGTNASDASDHRPGRQAALEYGVRSPLAEADLTKDEVRHLSRKRGLPTWDKPAMACLASRFAYGQEVTAERLGRIRRCEMLLRDVGCRTVRVRFHGDLARIEVGIDEIDAVVRARERIVRGFKAEGFVYITLDLQGFRSGSMNETLIQPRE